METESKQLTGADASAMPWLDNLKKLTDKYQLPGVNIEALIDRRNQILQETLAQWQSTVKDASSAKAASKVN